MDEWLITLRKHRNYSLREREDGWNNNNRDADSSIAYAYGAYCDVETTIEVGACCPLTCPVLKHGVIADVPLTRTTKEKLNQKTGEIVKQGEVKWDSVSGIQSKRTTQLRKENSYFSRIDSDVLQRNLAKLDAAYSGFWQHKRVEEARLLYVAMTRAIDQLVMTGDRNSKFVKRVKGALEKTG